MPEEEIEDDCPYNARGKHYFVNSVGPGVKADFIPVQFGETVAETLYKRVDYSMIGCNCGTVIKKEVVLG